jgi:hypothetical protein
MLGAAFVHLRVEKAQVRFPTRQEIAAKLSMLLARRVQWSAWLAGPATEFARAAPPLQTRAHPDQRQGQFDAFSA